MSEVKTTKKESIIEALSSAQELAFAPLTFQAISSLLDFKILEYLDKSPATISKVCSALNIKEYVVKTLFQVAQSVNIIKNTNGQYSTTKKGKAFLYDDTTIANFNFVKDVCYLGASELTNSFKDEKPRGLQKFIGNYPTIYPALTLLPEKMKESWYKFDHLYSDNCFDIIFKIIYAQFSKIYDIGGNTGKFERVCLKNNPNIDITMLDLPANISFIMNDKELTGCKFYPIDVLEQNVKYPQIENSAILMSQFLDCFSKEQITKILKDLYKTIDKDSKIFILEPFIDNQIFDAARLSLVHTSLYFTCMANGISKMYEQTEMEELLKSSGFIIEKTHNNIGSFDYTLLECKKE